MWTEALARQIDTCMHVFVVRVCVRACVRVCVHSHARVRNNRKGVQYFFAQIRYPRTLMGNCALCDCDPITTLPLPTSSHTLPSAPCHSSCHEKVIYVNHMTALCSLSEGTDYTNGHRWLVNSQQFSWGLSSHFSEESTYNNTSSLLGLWFIEGKTKALFKERLTVKLFFPSSFSML